MGKGGRGRRFKREGTYVWASQVVIVVKNLPANAGDIRDTGSIPGLGRSPGGGNGNPFQYSCLENPMDRGAWRATVHGVTQSQTRLKRLSTHTHTHTRLIHVDGGQKPKQYCKAIILQLKINNFKNNMKVLKTDNPPTQNLFL